MPGRSGEPSRRAGRWRRRCGVPGAEVAPRPERPPTAPAGAPGWRSEGERRPEPAARRQGRRGCRADPASPAAGRAAGGEGAARPVPRSRQGQNARPRRPLASRAGDPMASGAPNLRRGVRAGEDAGAIRRAQPQSGPLAADERRARCRGRAKARTPAHGARWRAGPAIRWRAAPRTCGAASGPARMPGRSGEPSRRAGRWRQMSGVPPAEVAPRPERPPTAPAGERAGDPVASGAPNLPAPHQGRRGCRAGEVGASGRFCMRIARRAITNRTARPRGTGTCGSRPRDALRSSLPRSSA